MNLLDESGPTFGQRAADTVARRMGSWQFIIIQASALSVWLVLNSVAWLNDWDPYPFILLNLVLSFQAAFSAPVIMMSQNRQAARDRREAEMDYEVDRRAEQHVAAVLARLDALCGAQWEVLLAIQHEQLALLRRLDALDRTARPADES